MRERRDGGTSIARTLIGRTDSMLKITRDQDARPDGGTLFRLEGQIAGRWVDELRLACTGSRVPPLTLDLKNVTFIDAAGIAFFDEVWTEITLVNCSLFAAEQLKDLTARKQTGK
jgi:hypothetical protein